MELRKNDTHTLTITGYASNGDGVGHLDGMAVFVKGALEGETVTVALTKVGRSACWARLVRVDTPSPARIEPDCPYYKLCGGCRTRHMTYEEELRFKRQRVDDALHRIGGLEVSVSAIHGAKNPDRYRNKAVFPVSQDKKNGVQVGFYRERSHDVVDVGSCLLQSAQADKAGRIVRKWMHQHQVPAYDERTGDGLIRHVFVRTNRRGESLICVVVNGKALPFEKELVKALRVGCPKAVGIVLNTNTRQTNVILGPQYRTLWGQDFLEDRLCGLTFRLSIPSFFQVNRDQAEVLYNLALDCAALTGKETVVDLYCGTGTISLVMARKAGKVIGAEIVPAAIQNAKENAARNGFANAEFLCADAGEAAQELARRGVRPDVVCVDPPRKGLDPAVIDAIAEMSPQRVVYVSCDPATLARDLKALAERGYCAQRVEAVDMFPRTGHVETVVQLSQQITNDIIQTKPTSH
ncbi:MAG: 23S rRNA (uracil(1939)-C(5))-methyltransferase RlmD [Clostridiales bacterium]|nr:23S rRNA (uracil(1939)-C(5))-methyltransferase RlmD [Clostridiales bacterium]